MEQKEDIKKQFAIETTKLTQEAFLKYKENEANKLIQIFHVTTAVVVALLAKTVIIAKAGQKAVFVQYEWNEIWKKYEDILQ